MNDFVNTAAPTVEAKPVAQSIKRDPSNAIGFVAVIALLTMAITGTIAFAFSHVESSSNDNSQPQIQGTNEGTQKRTYANKFLNISFEYDSDWVLTESEADECTKNCPEQAAILLTKGEYVLGMLVDRGVTKQRYCNFPDSVKAPDGEAVTLIDSVQLIELNNREILRRNVSPDTFGAKDAYYVCETSVNKAEQFLFTQGRENVSQIIYYTPKSADQNILGVMDEVVLSLGPVEPDL